MFMLQLSQRPLTTSAADARLFVDRESELDTVERAVRLGFNVLVLGQRGSGKTSLLHSLRRGCGDLSMVYVEGDVEWEKDSVPVLLERIGRTLGIPGGPPFGLAPMGQSYPEFRHTAYVASLAGQALPHLAAVDSARETQQPLSEYSVWEITRHISEREVVVLLDGVSESDAQRLFGRWRDAWWEAPGLRWVVAGVDASRAYLQPPADTFFEAVVELVPLSNTEATALLEARLDHAGDDPAAEALRGVLTELVAGLDEPTPRDVLTAARRVLLSSDVPAVAVRRQSVDQQRAAALGRHAAMVFAEVERLGPVHAGDERLLSALGYSRPRVVQILKVLEGVGLVAARREGRRVLYEVHGG